MGYNDSSDKIVFGDNEQKELVEWCRKLSDNGATVWLANKDNGDGFFEDLLGDRVSYFRTDVIYKMRNSDTKESSTELLMVFEPDGSHSLEGLFQFL